MGDNKSHSSLHDFNLSRLLRYSLPLSGHRLGNRQLQFRIVDADSDDGDF